MKLICLNIWGGKIHDPLLKLIKEKAIDTDIFCFQENFSSDRLELLSLDTYSNIHEQICKILSGFTAFYYPTIEYEDVRKKVDFPLSHGQVTFVKKNLNVLKSGDIFVYREKNEMGPRYPGGLPDFPKNFIYCEIEHNERKFLVINLHGFWNPAPKTDTPQRLKQSEMIISFVKKYNLPVVIAGDFNLEMNTKSVGLFTEKGFRNLVKESGAKTTRSSLYDIKWRYTDPFADYIFVSDDVKLIDFKVLPDEVSDHLPLYLEFEI